MKWQDGLALVVLAAMWGASFLFMRTATPEFGAIALVAVRTGIAAMCLIPIMMMRRKWPDFVLYWRPILFVGVVNTAIPFCLFSYATVHLGAGFGAILNATAPMFGALMAVVWLHDKLGISGVLGLIVGFIGVVVVSSLRVDEGAISGLLPIAAALCATTSYGIAACYTKKRLAGVSTLAIATGSQIMAALVLAPLAAMTWPQTLPSASAWTQVAVLGVACTGLAYLLYFRLIENVGAAKAMTVGYLVTVFGVLWGILFLDEVLYPRLIVGAALIIIGVSMTTGWLRWRRIAARAS
ncbi:DMT family transporter [Aestuariibacter halophilus]|uniref:DMT family transporter n=1 Tax=Fluctibacter halophilus TaxID=226011 RepID=A0ABS8G9E2_9ALTE|nr:DMT family transporter [Aestuariibacter halophilus]MCC2617123.1 DMT family transporter [Aestuariibacter halophilus]